MLPNFPVLTVKIVILHKISLRNLAKLPQESQLASINSKCYEQFDNSLRNPVRLGSISSKYYGHYKMSLRNPVVGIGIGIGSKIMCITSKKFCHNHTNMTYKILSENVLVASVNHLTIMNIS